MMRQQPSIFSITSAAVCLLWFVHTSQAGVSYEDPNGGWRYTYEGTFNPGVPDGPDGDPNDNFVGDFGPDGYGKSDQSEALDGTFFHDQGDKWDGTAPGDTLSDPNVPSSPLGTLTGRQGTSPGGAGGFTEGSTNYIRIQDAGNPEVHGWVQGNLDDPNGPGHPINTNRRVYFGHDMTSDGALDELVLTNTGITFSIRVRIPDSGPLDDVYSVVDGPDPDSDPDVIPWFQDAPNGRGKAMTNGRGTINISQNSPTNVDTQVGFSLVTSTDITRFCGSDPAGSLCAGSDPNNPVGGLIMNNLVGDVPSNLIDSESAGTLNILEISDSELNEWNEFWITMENNLGLPGNIEVNVYRNGSTTPDTFQVTLAANNNSVYADEDNPFIEFGISDNGDFGSFDMDFISYQIGVITPVAAPVLDADFDDNNIVDGRDFLIWQRGLGTGTTNGDGDANGDSVVDDLDLAIWESQYGSPPPLVGALSSIPEPSALALGLLATLSCAIARRRR